VDQIGLSCEKEPLIHAAFGSLISADQRNDSQRRSAVASSGKNS
jgi:hypothetical protein